MVVGNLGGRTELAIIGSGPGGYVAALRAADAGIEVALIENGPVGGTCLNVGCIPSKTLIEAANLRHRAASHPGFQGELAVEMGAIGAHMAQVSDRLREGVGSLLNSAGVKLVTGTAQFNRYDRLSIEHDGNVSFLEFDNAIVATGSRPVGIPGFPWGERVLDSTAALALSRVPRHLAIVGGGYIGVELGTAFAKLGSAVTIIEADESILPTMHRRLRRPVERGLTAAGVRVLTSCQAAQITDSGVLLDDGQEVRADVAVIAVGRRPNSDTCSIETAGGRVDEVGFIVVDEQLRAAPNLYAIGDVVAGPALAHRASADAERVVAHLAGRAHAAPIAVPAVVFSDPEIITVGMSLDDATAARCQVHAFHHGANARALTMDSGSGATYVVCDDDETIVGVHAVGPHVSELAGEAALAVELAATLTDLGATMHPHPTVSETLPEAALAGLGHPLHIRPRTRR